MFYLVRSAIELRRNAEPEEISKGIGPTRSVGTLTMASTRQISSE
jgi:hypothetical protein